LKNGRKEIGVVQGSSEIFRKFFEVQIVALEAVHLELEEISNVEFQMINYKV